MHVLFNLPDTLTLKEANALRLLMHPPVLEEITPNDSDNYPKAYKRGRAYSVKSLVVTGNQLRIMTHQQIEVLFGEVASQLHMLGVKAVYVIDLPNAPEDDSWFEWLFTTENINNQLAQKELDNASLN